jgi:hypothetical protein
MTVDSIQFDKVYISINGYSIPAKDFADADIDITTGGDGGETRAGKGGGRDVLFKDDSIDSLKFTLRGSSSMVDKLRDYRKNHVPITDLIVKDMNPMRQRTWTTNAAHVKSFDDVAITDASSWAFTIECIENFE